MRTKPASGPSITLAWTERGGLVLPALLCQSRVNETNKIKSKTEMCAQLEMQGPAFPRCCDTRHSLWKLAGW